MPCCTNYTAGKKLVKREEITLLAAKAAAVSPGVCTNKRGSSFDSVTITGLPYVELNSCYTYAQLDDNELPIFLTSDRKSGIVQTGTYLEDTKVRVLLQLLERACAHVHVLDQPGCAESASAQYPTASVLNQVYGAL
jgi:hypothetical protein